MEVCWHHNEEEYTKKSTRTDEDPIVVVDHCIKSRKKKTKDVPKSFAGPWIRCPRGFGAGARVGNSFGGLPHA